MSTNYIDDLFDNLRRDPFKTDPTNQTSYELQRDFLDDPEGPEGWIADGVIGDTQLIDGATLVGKVDALPTLPDAEYPEGKVVYLTTDGKLYRNDSDVWTAAVATVDLTGQITETQITDSAITTPKIAANAIVADKIAANAITTDKLNANAVTAAKIAAGTITATEIATSTITADNMVAGTITAASGIIADAAITNAKIADATIQSAKIANLVATKIISGTQGLLIQGAAVGVDAAFGGEEDALLFSGITVGDVGITSIGDAALGAPNKVYLSPDAITLPDQTAGSGVSIVGFEGVSIHSPQALIGDSDDPATGNTALFDSDGVFVNADGAQGVAIMATTGDVSIDADTKVKIIGATGVDIYKTLTVTPDADVRAGTLELSTSLKVGSTVNASVPTGSVTAYLGAYNNLPDGWLLCNGSYVDRTTYAALFDVIGTSYGTTTASNFRLPDLLGYMMVGGTSTLVPGSGSLTGSADSYLNATWDHDHSIDVPSTTSSSDSHTHAVDPAATTSGGPSTTTTLNYSSGGTSATVATSTHTHSTNILSFTSGSDSHSHTVNPAAFTSGAMSVSPTQKRARVNYIIKY